MNRWTLQKKQNCGDPLRVPYTYIAIALCLFVGFFKTGDLDEEIGWGLGLGTGVLVLVVNHFLPGGYLRLGLYAVGGFVLLTLYKIIRDLPESKKNRTQERYRTIECGAFYSCSGKMLVFSVLIQDYWFLCNKC